MKAWFVAAGLSLATVSTLAPAARAEGPRASSEHNWTGMSAPSIATGVVEQAAPLAGPRPSSENNWPGMAKAAPAQYAAEAPAHYLWQEGYDAKGKWHGHWTLVQ